MTETIENETKSIDYSRRILIGDISYTSETAKNPLEVELKLKRVKVPENENPKLSWNLSEIRTYTTISICGKVWYRNYRDCYEAGQIRDTVRESFPDNPEVQRIVELWEEWHLNDLKSGTVEQSYFIKGYEAGNPDWRYDYSEASEILKEAGLFEVRGYKYGHAWLVREVPDSVVSELMGLFESFPEGKGR